MALVGTGGADPPEPPATGHLPRVHLPELPDPDPESGRPRIINTDRPHVAEAPVTVGTGVFQIESGFLWVSSREHEQTGFTPTLLRLGVGPTTELRLESDLLTSQERRLELSDVTLGLKQVLFSEGVEVALLLNYTLASGTPAVRGVPEPELKLLLGFELTEGVELELNLGTRITTDPGRLSRYLQGTFACAVTGSVSDELALFGEVFGDAPVGLGQGGALTAQTGLLYLVDDDLQLDVEVLRGLSGAGLNWGFGLGVSARY